jgi:ABC-2 type transport system permease protein
MTSARVFFLGGLVSYRALFGWLSPWVYIPSLLVAPIFQILLFVYIGRSAQLESDEFYVVGNALQYASIPCLFAMTHTIAGERFQQTLGSILITPARRLPLFVGRALPVVVNGFFVAAFALLVGGAIVGVDVPSSAYGPIALVTAVSAFACTGLGLLNAGVGLIVRETGVLSNVIFGVLLVCSGANVPIADLAQTVARLQPALVCLSATNRRTAQTLTAAAHAIAQLPEPRAPVAFGGEPFNADPELRARVAGHYLGADAQAAVDAIERLLG